MFILASSGTYVLVFAGVVVLGLAGIVIVLQILRRKGESAESSPYEISLLLTPAERAFWLVLKQHVPEGCVLFSKVRLADMVKVKKGFDNSVRTTYNNRIRSKHADFVLCDAEDLTPRVVVELDDASHNRAKNAERDHKKDKILKGVGVAMLRIKAQRSYNTEDLQQRIAAALGIGRQPENAGPAADAVTPQSLAAAQVNEAEVSCPKCGSEMVPRVAKRGENMGQEFWGCSRYPDCRGVIKQG